MLLGTNTIELLEVSNNCLAHLSPFHVAQVQLLRVVALPPEGVVMPDRELHLVPRSTNVLVFAKLNTIGVESCWRNGDIVLSAWEAVVVFSNQSV